MNENLREIDARRIRPDGTRANACWNREPLKTKWTVTGIRDASERVGEMTYIPRVVPFRVSWDWPEMSTDCEYTKRNAAEGRTDPACAGCRWIKEKEAC